jgi:hypothetical protein
MKSGLRDALNMGKKQPDHPSGKVRRSACVERYRRDKFTRLDTSA